MEAYIPKNIDDNGGVLGGFFKKRNTIEAIGVVSFIILLFRFFIVSIPLIIRFISAITLSAVLGMFFLIGINNQPVSITILDYINFMRTRCVVTLKKPMPENTAVVTAQKRKIKIKIKKRRRRK